MVFTVQIHGRKKTMRQGLRGLSVQAYNQLQKYVIEHSRLGIPFY